MTVAEARVKPNAACSSERSADRPAHIEVPFAMPASRRSSPGSRLTRRRKPNASGNAALDRAISLRRSRDLGAATHADERPEGRGGDEVEGEQHGEQRFVADGVGERADQQREQRAAEIAEHAGEPVAVATSDFSNTSPIRAYIMLDSIWWAKPPSEKHRIAVIGSTTKLISAGPTMHTAPIEMTVSRALTMFRCSRLCRLGAR